MRIGTEDQVVFYCIQYHMLAFFLGFLLDLAFGDPYFLPHPIRLIGKGIHMLEKKFLKEGGHRNKKRELRCGKWLVLTVSACTVLISAFLLAIAYHLHRYLGLAAEAVMTYQILAAKCLKTESMKVYQFLKKKDLPGARGALAMIVGRDTARLEEDGMIKAAVETVAENTSDGVLAPMLYTALGGPVLGFFYKAVNTMDSMVGYKNDRYLYFGRAAAKLDDVLNYIPSRASAYVIILSAFLLGKDFSGKQAFLIYKRDNRKHASPNSAQTESACAGALGIQLAGDASYFGKIVRKPYIGDKLRAVECEDIRRANRLMYFSAWICACVCLIGMLLLEVGL